MPGLNIDFGQWPTWLLFLLIVVNLFKQQIGAVVPAVLRDFFQFRAGRQADREEFQQEMAEVQLNNRLQIESSEVLRKSWREEQWVELLQQMLAWLREDLAKDLDQIEAGQVKLQETMIQVQRNTTRTNDILTTIHIALSKMADKQEKRGGENQAPDR